MKAIYVTGGQQRRSAPRSEEWHHYRRAVLARIRPGHGAADVLLRYTSPRDVCALDEPSIVFKGGTILGRHLYVCTQTEVLTIDLCSHGIVRTLSLPLFNDLHHVRPLGDGTLLVVNTGLDMVVRVTCDGELVEAWNTLGGDPWRRFSRAMDYRRVPTTKPHASHPNFVFELGGVPWVTRLEQRDAICLADPDRRIVIGVERPHDGFVRDGRVYFTTVDGRIVVADAGTLQVTRVMDLNRLNDSGLALGWCRGLLVGPDRLWVGFSRLRPTRFRRNLSWLKHRGTRVGLHNSLPTRIACYDRDCTRVLEVVDLEPCGVNAVFTILDASSTAG